MTININVYAIAKDEDSNYKNFVASAAEADMIFIGDTGSEDTSYVQSFCAEQGIEWFDMTGQVLTDPSYFDFSDHRNFLLGYVEGMLDTVSSSIEPPTNEFLLSLDLDERLEAGWRDKLVALIEDNPQANALQFDIYVEDGNPYSFKAVRGHAKGTHDWEYPVHEILSPSNGRDKHTQNILDTGIRITHKPGDKKRDYLPACFAFVDAYKNEPRAYHYLGRELMYAGKYNEALGVFARYLNLGENGIYLWKEESAIIYNYIAFCNEHLDNVFGAEVAYYNAMVSTPKSREPWMDLSDFYFRQDKFVESYTFLKRASELPHTDTYMYKKPAAYNDMYVQHQACFIAFKAGLTTEAKKHITKAVQLANGKPSEGLVRDYVSLFGKVPEFR